MTKERRTPRSRATGSLRPYEQVVIEAVRPSIEAGRFAAKALVGENFAVEASVFRHGHERLRAALRWRVPHETTFHEAPMTLFNPGLDLWRAEIPLERVGRHHYRVVAWKDPYATWVEELGKRVRAAQADVSSEIAEGLALVARVARNVRGDARCDVDALLQQMHEAASDPVRLFSLRAGRRRDSTGGRAVRPASP